MTGMLDSAASTAGQYRPGVCNIGPAEIGRRRRSAITATVVAAIVALAIVAAGLPAIARLVLLPFAAAAAVTWLQVTRRFCVGFGAAGILNFGSLGTTISVTDAAARAADRRTALRMVLEGLVLGAVATLAYWAVTGWILPG